MLLTFLLLAVAFTGAFIGFVAGCYWTQEFLNDDFRDYDTTNNEDKFWMDEQLAKYKADNHE